VWHLALHIRGQNSLRKEVEDGKTTTLQTTDQQARVRRPKAGGDRIAAWLPSEAEQLIERAAFILAEDGALSTIGGYYTLSSSSIALDGIAQRVQKRLPRYPLVPAMLIGRLARDIRFRKAGVGALLLLDAIRRALHASAQIGADAVAVDAIDESAAAFYGRYGFIPLEEGGSRLYLPMESIRKLEL
jgi:hypothetical protein